jgi:hypothetical protein
MSHIQHLAFPLQREAGSLTNDGSPYFAKVSNQNQ